MFKARAADGRIPEEGPKLEIHSKNGVIVLRSDADGYVEYPFSVALVKENPIIKKLNENIAFELRITDVTRVGINQRIELSVGDKPYIESGPCRLWYPTGNLERAKEVLTDLKAARAFIRNELGVEPSPWGINIVAQDLNEVNYTTLQDFPKWFTWSYPIAGISTAKERKSNVHEWVEHTLSEEVGLKQSSKGGSNRCVFDGLAEYVSIRFAKHIPPFYLSDLQKLLAKNVNKVDLTEQFRWQAKQYRNPEQLMDELTQFTAGYPLSYAFWEGLSRQYGRDMPKRFVSQLKQYDQGNIESCIRILGQLTRSNQVQSHLKSMDVNKAVQLIQEISESYQDKTDIEPADAVGPR